MQFLKVTSLGSEQSVIPIQRIYEVFRAINADHNPKGISVGFWMKAVRNINATKIPNNKPKASPPVVPKGSPVPPDSDSMDDDEDKEEMEENVTQKTMVSNHLSSVHIMTVMKCIGNVWDRLGPAHRESAYQKAFMVCSVSI